MTPGLRNHRMVLIGLGGALATATACSNPEAVREADAKQTTQASSVVVDALDANGTSMGSCSGTLIGPKVVLTAGHCIAGVGRWQVSRGSAQSSASVASTPWKNFRSDLSHPEHSDIGLIVLDQPIKLDSYPEIATAKAKDGAKAVRFHRESAKTTSASATSTRLTGGEKQGFRVNYLLEAANDEWLDTGGAVLDGSGKIVGVVSGRGKQTGSLHVARLDGFASWAKSAVSCASRVATRTWGAGSSGNGGAGYGGTPGSENSNTSSSSSSSGGWGGSSSGGGGGWGSSSGGYGGGTSGTGGLPPGFGGSNLDGGATVPGSSGSSGSSGTADEDSESSGSPGSGNGGTNGSGSPATETCPGTPHCGGSDCGAGSSPNGGPDAEGAPSPGGDEDECSGASDNPTVCPPKPDSASCSGPSCGGCTGNAACSDSNIDYGACPSCSSGEPIVK